MEISFSAFEYRENETFHEANYRYLGSRETGWKIFRNKVLFETLGPGYELLKTLYCGICSTDIARAKLPFPLPQITGHEIVALYHQQPVVVDINASHAARAVPHQCYYCNHSMANHCPERLTLGIDRLPGGFSPYVLAPKNAIYPLPKKLPPNVAVVIEPFAAALHAVENTPIENGIDIAIVGPKRLGLLLIMALAFYRKKTGLKFSINGIVRHDELSEACLSFGADRVFRVNELASSNTFDIVYDTSGSISGFELSMKLAKKTVHVKSTHGQEIAGFTQLTRMVIDELSLFPLGEENNVLRLASSLKDKKHILIDEKIPSDIKRWLLKNFKEKIIVTMACFPESLEEIKKQCPDEGFLKFDAALVTSIEALNHVISAGLVRAKGDVFWCCLDEKPPALWSMFFEKNIELTSSRCGNFSRSLRLIEQNVDQFSVLIKQYITDCFEVKDINAAFDVARNNPASIKILIKHSESFE